MMQSLGYSAEEIQCAGDAVKVFKGVNNPHIHAKIKTGENVLDLGQSITVDSFIAAKRVGDEGVVFSLSETDDGFQKD